MKRELSLGIPRLLAFFLPSSICSVLRVIVQGQTVTVAMEYEEPLRDVPLTGHDGCGYDGGSDFRRVGLRRR